MKNTKKGSDIGKALLMGTALVSLSSYQAEAATGTGLMSAIILTPIDVTSTQVLHFGSMSVTTAVGTITVVPNGTGGTRNAGTGSVTEIAGAGLESEGALQITAATGLVMNVALTAGPFTVDDPGAGLPMTVDTFMGQAVPAAFPFTTSIVGPATNVIVPVGATLNVPAGQEAAVAGITPATFTGSYTVDVNYM